MGSFAIRPWHYLMTVGALLTTGCPEDEGPAEQTPVEIAFEATFGDEAFQCGHSYADIGLGASTVTPEDLRLFVHDVRVVDDTGTDIPIALDVSSEWQTGDVVLLDFEDATGPCTSGDPGTNARVVGTIPAGTIVAGLRFTFGVPFEPNHQDQSTASAPLDVSTMWWGWLGGYKFLRFDAQIDGSEDVYRIHLGSTGCENGEDGLVASCTRSNRAEVAFERFDPEVDRVALDVSILLAGSNLDENTPNTAPGCMSEVADPDCDPILTAFGMSTGEVFETDPALQVVFAVAD